MPGEADIPTLVTFDAEGRVAEDLSCVECGYNLRTLEWGSRCPECATPILRSLRLNWLLVADPKWLRKIAGGLRQLVRMTGFALACVIAAIVLFPFAMLISPWPFLPPIVVGVLSLVAFCYMGINVVEGVWRFTAQQPASGEPADLRLRLLIRLMTAITVATAAITMGLLWNRADKGTLFLAGVCSLSCYLCCHVAVLAYLRRLALRMSAYKEARMALLLAIAFVVGIALTLVGGWGCALFVFVRMSTQSRGMAPDFYGYALMAGGLLDAGLLILFAILANRLYVTLDATIRGIAATDDPGVAAAIAARTMLILGSSR
jgi:hypothetical protein